MKPSFANTSVALMVSPLCGNKYFESFIISTFTKSPQPVARDSRAMRIASSASLAPLVLGIKMVSFGIASKIFSTSPPTARRRAKVIISAPASSRTASIKSIENFPDPKINRECNVCPPKVHVSCVSISFTEIVIGSSLINIFPM